MDWIISIIVIILAVVYTLAHRCFDDEDPDMYWSDNFADPPKGIEAPAPCQHLEATDIVVNVACTCEEIYTLCDSCNQVINIRTDC